MIKEIPASKLYVCDICHVTEESQRQQNTWYSLILARNDSVNYASSMNKHICPYCWNEVTNAIGRLQEKYAPIRDMDEIKDTLGNKDVIARLQAGHMQNNPRRG